MNTLSIRVIVFLIWVGLLTSCSTSTDFVIINSSDKEIEIRYQFKVRNEVRYPAILSYEDFKAHKEWHQLTEAGTEFQLDEQATTFTYRLAPNSVLLLDNLPNYEKSKNDFRIQKISISGTSGSMDFTGQQIESAFKELGSGDLGFVYQ